MLSHYTEEIDFLQEGLYLAEKHRGETLAVFLRRFRVEHDISDTEKITYAGRLDPMAEGVMIVLVGKARFEKERFLKLAKTYETEIIFGFTTDTLDALGIITEEGMTPEKNMITQVFEKLPEKLLLPYPRYSSQQVAGKPLFSYARSNTNVTVPTGDSVILEKTLLGIEEVTIEALAKDAIETITKVQGDFRQILCMESWQQFKNAHAGKKYLAATFRFTVSSGTYIRALAEWLGEQAGSAAYAHRIKRVGFVKK